MTDDIIKADLENCPELEEIYLQPFEGHEGETTWCQDQVHEDDIVYIRKDIATEREKALVDALEFMNCQVAEARCILTRMHYECEEVLSQHKETKT